MKSMKGKLIWIAIGAVVLFLAVKFFPKIKEKFTAMTSK